MVCLENTYICSFDTPRFSDQIGYRIQHQYTRQVAFSSHDHVPAVVVATTPAAKYCISVQFNCMGRHLKSDHLSSHQYYQTNLSNMGPNMNPSTSYFTDIATSKIRVKVRHLVPFLKHNAQNFLILSIDPPALLLFQSCYSSCFWRKYYNRMQHPSTQLQTDTSYTYPTTQPSLMWKADMPHVIYTQRKINSG